MVDCSYPAGYCRKDSGVGGASAVSGVKNTTPSSGKLPSRRGGIPYRVGSSGTGSALAVGRLRTVLAKVVVFLDVVGNASLGSSQKHAAEGQPGNVFKDVGVFHGFGGSSAPRKGRVAGNQYAGNRDGVEVFTAEQPNDDCAGVPDVGFGDFLFRKGLGDGNAPMEIVGVGGAETGNGAAGLRP